MELTTQELAYFVGGQVEIKNRKSYIRGEIGKISVDDCILNIYFTWLAEALDYPVVTGHWRMKNQRTYEGSIAPHRSERLPGGILNLSSPNEDADRLLFHPPHSSGLHLSLIES